MENRVCLSHSVQVTGAAWRAMTRIMAGVGDLVQRTGDGATGRVLGGRTIERSGDAICGMHHARGDDEHRCLGLASKPRSMVCQWFVLKIIATVSRFGPQNWWLRFGDLGHKITAMVSWFGPQNQVVYDLSIASKPMGG
jgi:hypothetical protein